MYMTTMTFLQLSSIKKCNWINNMISNLRDFKDKNSEQKYANIIQKYLKIPSLNLK